MEYKPRYILSTHYSIFNNLWDENDHKTYFKTRVIFEIFLDKWKVVPEMRLIILNT